MKPTLSVFCLVLTMFFLDQAQAQSKRQTKKTYSYEQYENSVKEHEWDFTGLIGLYNPGTGFGARAAYRIFDDILPSSNDTLSVESGLTFISVSESVLGVNSSYSYIEIPVHARWDFHVANKKLLVGPVAGFNYLTSATVTINGQPYTISRSGGLFVQLGASGIYYFNENFGARAQLLVGSYTTLIVGVNYAL
ncbi:MAG: hypothetical protein IPM57_05840 [Oligoflexia bacterium]|nr:hypothetical protein [Oligoflexia bacterium]